MRGPRAAAIALAAAAALGCGALHQRPAGTSAPVASAAPPPVPGPAPSTETEPPPDPPAAPGMEPLVGDLDRGQLRPRAARPVRFDVDTLPLATWGPPKAGGGFSMTETQKAFRVTIRSPLFAEIVVPSAIPSSAFEIFTGGSFSSGELPHCGPRHLGSAFTYWSGISARGWTDGAVIVEMGRGSFDYVTCNATPTASIAARAAAIVPGYVYGLRVRSAGSELEPATEQLFVFLPRGVLVAAGGDPNLPLNASNSGAFTRLTLPADAGTAGSASLRVSPASLRLWGELRRTGRPVWSFADKASASQELLLGVDVVSQGATRLGSVTVSMPPMMSTVPYEALFRALRKAAG